jgi:hypothetical protein
MQVDNANSATSFRRAFTRENGDGRIVDKMMLRVMSAPYQILLTLLTVKERAGLDGTARVFVCIGAMLR